VSSPTIFVINDNTRAYPAYVITYEAPNDRQFYASAHSHPPKVPTAAAAAKAAAAAAAKAAATVAASKAAFAAATAAATKALQKSARTPRARGPSSPLGTKKAGDAAAGEGKGAAAAGEGKGAAATATPTASSTEAFSIDAERKKRGLQESTGREQKRQRSDIHGRTDGASVSSAGGGCHAVGGADINGGMGIFRTRQTGAFSHDVIVIDD
jgi:hypothetical protein